jgi:hypothetical protein
MLSRHNKHSAIVYSFIQVKTNLRHVKCLTECLINSESLRTFYYDSIVHGVEKSRVGDLMKLSLKCGKKCLTGKVSLYIQTVQSDQPKRL